MPELLPELKPLIPQPNNQCCGKRGEYYCQIFITGASAGAFKNTFEFSEVQSNDIDIDIALDTPFNLV